MKRLLLSLAVAALLPAGMQAQPLTSNYQLLNVNRISAWMRADGQSAHSPRGEEGIVYPRWTSWTVYQDGILWAAKAYLDSNHTTPVADRPIRVGGQTYNVGTQRGWVVGQGANAVPADPALPAARIYRIRRDFTGTFDDYGDAAEFFGIPRSEVTYTQVEQIREAYRLDWSEWPVEHGAPYIERNGVPGYQPPPYINHPEDLISNNYDEPGIAGVDPSVPADMVLWTVYNDLNRAVTQGLYGSPPLGLEVQVTLWAYNRSSGLGHQFFKRVRIINKGGVLIDSVQKGALWLDSVFVAQWSDTDLGSFGDDLLGCDPDLHLSYTYNSNSADEEFMKFNIPPPAFGYAFLYGPTVPGGLNDSAVFDFRRIYSRRNLGMTSFSPKSVGTAYSDPSFTYDGALRWWRWIQGYLPEAPTTPWNLYQFPPGMQQTKFPLSGDPVSRSGFIDGLGTAYSLSPGSRRFSTSTGPFRLAPGDTQEVVLAATGGLGADHLTSISALKYNVRVSRAAANLLFALPSPPPQPAVKVIELNQEIVLDWGSDIQKAKNVEEFTGRGGYLFEGYNVYQLPSATSSLTEGVRIATFDAVNNVANIVDEVYDYNSGLVVPTVVQHGTNSGVQRFFRAIENMLQEPYNRTRLRNGTTYYFAVTAYNYSSRPDASPKSLESAPVILSAKPRIPFGMQGLQTHGDTLAVGHTGGRSDGKVHPIVVNPLAGTGHTYEVRFDTVGESITWKLRNATKDTILMSGQTNQTGDRNYDIVEGGIYLQVIGPPPGMKDWAVPSGERRFTWSDGYMNFEGFERTIGWNEPSFFFGITPERTVKAHELRNVLLKLAPANSGTTGNPDAGGNPYGGWNENNPGTNANFSYAYRYLRAATSPPGRPEFAPYIVNQTGGYAYQDYKRGVPLSAWDVEANPPVRLAVGHLENNVATGLVDGKWWPGSNGTGSAGNSASTREWLFIFRNPYTGATPDTALQVDILNNSVPIMYWLGVQRRAGANFSAGDEFLILANHANGPDDVFEYVVPAPQSTPEIQKASAERVGVFPNPYYAGHSDGGVVQGRFVTFNNLPPKATIRIFNIAGHAVRTLHKESDSQFFEWDLTNDHQYLVASGMYICHVDMPEVGATKVLKLAIIQGEPIPAVK